MHVKIKFRNCSLVMQSQSDSPMRVHLSCWMLFEHLHFYQTAPFSPASFQHAADISSFCTYNLFIKPKVCIVKKDCLTPIFLSSSLCCPYHMQIQQSVITTSACATGGSARNA